MDTTMEGPDKITCCDINYPADKYDSCLKCGKLFTATSTTPASTVKQTMKGNSGQAIQIGGNNQGNIIIQQPAQTEEPTTFIHRESITPLRFGNTYLKNLWLFIAGGLGVAANLVEILTFFRQPLTGATTLSHVLMWVMIVSALLLLAAFMLQRQKYIPLLFGRTIEKDRQGYLYLTKIGGTCGLCRAPVRINTVGPKEHRQTRVECTNNPDQHWCAFDRTVLGDVGDEHRQQQQ